MKVAYITAGAADMFCGSCLHDNSLVAALQRKGHQALLIPTYTPLRTDEPNVSIDRVFYGGINVYLEQKLSLFRHTPEWLDSLFRHPSLLRLLSRLASSTDARSLGALTLSIARGERGHQRKELERLIRWLRQEVRPDLVQLTNSLLLGLVRSIREELQVPVLCALQGEDIFLEDLVEPYRSEVIEVLRERAGQVDGFLATSQYFAEFMSAYLTLPRDKIHVVRPGLNLADHMGAGSPDAARPFTIGYLARICPEKGLHLLADAFRQLCARTGKARFRLSVAGYLGKQHEPYLRGIQKKISQWGLEDRFDLWGEVDRRRKIQFLQQLHLLSVPTVYREPKGLFVLEALANGVPVVQPRHGAFPELLEQLQGGILVDPGSASQLADAFQSLYENPQRREELGRAGRESVRAFFNDEAMADATLAVYSQYLSEKSVHGVDSLLD